MIREVTMFAVFCDNCGKQCEDENAGFCAWSDEVGARESACESGWYEDGGNYYCPYCYSFDDDDNLVLKDMTKCGVNAGKNVTKSHVNDDKNVTKTEGGEG